VEKTLLTRKMKLKRQKKAWVKKNLGLEKQNLGEGGPFGGVYEHSRLGQGSGKGGTGIQKNTFESEIMCPLLGRNKQDRKKKKATK